MSLVVVVLFLLLCRCFFMVGWVGYGVVLGRRGGLIVLRIEVHWLGCILGLLENHGRAPCDTASSHIFFAAASPHDAKNDQAHHH